LRVLVVQALFSLLAAVFVVGALARFALPGPDPLPVWFTIVLGVGGALFGALVVAIYVVAAGRTEESFLAGQGIFATAAVAGATGLYFLYRRFGQNRPITGPGAQRLPLKPRGLNRILRGKPHKWLEETAVPGAVPVDQLAKLVALRDAGKIDAAEFDRRKAALVEKI
jgi:uncharacterized membrane protein YeaQ/YmgE (transglycosylase-associated protein family)